MTLRHSLSILLLACALSCIKSFEQIAPEPNSTEASKPTVRISATTTTAPPSDTSTQSQYFSQAPSIPCALPPFVNQMPPAYSEQLKKVWIDYKPGKHCGYQQAQTFEIVAKLSPEVKTRIFGPPPETLTGIPAPAKQYDLVPEPGAAIIPMFIRTAPPQIKQMFDAVLSNNTMNESDKFAALEKLAAKNLTPEQLVDFNFWIASLKINSAKINARINALSEEASQVLRQITELRIKERNILQSVSPKIVAELIGLI
uniref:DUF148 domain-containing protein n=1 Tax=Syphacia muris TaxID=451379 RepID=A0A0N5AK36_9BILA